MPRPRPLASWTAVLACALAPGLLHASTHTWTGAFSNLVSPPANWAEGVAPAPGEINLVLVFPAGPAVKGISNDVSSLTISEIRVEADGYQFSGQAVSLAGGVFLSGPNGATSTLSFPILLTSAQTFSAATGTSLRIHGSISGGPAAHLTTSGGIITFAASSTYQGETIVSSGSLIVTNPAGLGAAPAGTRVLAGTHFRFEGVGKTLAEPLELTQDAVLYLAPLGTTAADPLVVSSPIVTTGSKAGLQLWWSGAHVRLTGPISGSASLSFGQAYPLPVSTVELAGPATWGGSTGIASKVKLLVSTTLPPTSVGMTQSDSFLGGTGSLPGNVAISAGTLTPGASPGLLAIGGNLSLAGAASVLAVELAGPTPGAGYDQVAVGGNVTLGGSTLSVSSSFQAAPGTVFTILTAGGAVSGTFAGLPSGASFVAGGQGFQISYGAKAVVLTAQNTAPTLTPGGVVSVERGIPESGAVLATAADVESAAGSLAVSLVDEPAGIAVTNLTNTGGIVTATLSAACAASLGAQTVELSVSDGLATTPASVNVTVAPDATGPTVTFPGSGSFVARQISCSPARGMNLAKLATTDPTLYASYQAFVGGVSAVDGCTPTPIALGLQVQGAPLDDSTFLAAGQSHTLTARFADAEGNVGSGDATLVVAFQGDLTLDGNVDVLDVVTLMSAVVGNVTPGLAPHLAPSGVGDENGDGTVDVFDVVLLMAFVVGNMPCLTP